jgi:hypothetical protein
MNEESEEEGRVETHQVDRTSGLGFVGISATKRCIVAANAIINEM